MAFLSKNELIYPISEWEEFKKVQKEEMRYEFLLGQELHIWMVKTNELESSYFWDFLLPKEQIKASKFRIEVDRHRYIISHAVLQLLLGFYINGKCNPEEIKVSKYGKPFLSTVHSKNGFHFNITHSQDVACFIFSKKNNVGIDIEFIDSEIEWRNVAEDNFTISELRYLNSSFKKDQVKEFYKIWTRKEALLKAIGVGLAELDEMKKIKLGSEINNYLLGTFEFDDKYIGAFSTLNGSCSCKYLSITNYLSSLNRSWNVWF
jgi:4'-phosphopantetheinyl transferase